MRSHLSEARWTKEIPNRSIEPGIKVIHPKYYIKLNQSCTFLLLRRFGRQGSIENFCSFAKVLYFWRTKANKRVTNEENHPTEVRQFSSRAAYTHCRGSCYCKKTPLRPVASRGAHCLFVTEEILYSIRAVSDQGS